MEVTCSLRLALIVVDVQRDFCPGGSLAVKKGDKIILKLNKVIRAFQNASLPIFFTRDWHPLNHSSFKGQGGIWPPHCVMGTAGAEFHQALSIPPGSAVISKGTNRAVDAYSGFQGTDLEEQLKRLHVGEVFLAGLATDYCVKESALDAINAGFKVNVLKDCTKGVNLKRSDSPLALRAVIKHGARLITSEDAVKRTQRAAMKSSS
jgi:nicotinamidase/pyrazinamidase